MTPKKTNEKHQCTTRNTTEKHDDGKKNPKLIEGNLEKVNQKEKYFRRKEILKQQQHQQQSEKSLKMA